jgi:opacity protein-like surface antigen
MMKQIAVFCLATVSLLPSAWAQQASPADEPTIITPPEARGSDYAEDPVPAGRARSTSPLAGFYAGAIVGPVFFRDNSVGAIDIDYETGGQLAAFFGKRFGILRTEAEIASQGVEFDPSNSQFDGDLSIFRATANLYLDVASFDAGRVHGITPYVGGGLGFAVADIEGFDDDDAAFTAQGEVGVSVPIIARLDVISAYRFEWTDFEEFDDDQHAHTLRVGARYNF